MKTISRATGALVGVVLRKAGVGDLVNGFMGELFPPPPPKPFFDRMMDVLAEAAPTLAPIVMSMLNQPVSTTPADDVFPPPHLRAVPPMPRMTPDPIMDGVKLSKRLLELADLKSFTFSVQKNAPATFLVEITKNGLRSTREIPSSSLITLFAAAGAMIERFDFEQLARVVRNFESPEESDPNPTDSPLPPVS